MPTSAAARDSCLEEIDAAPIQTLYNRLQEFSPNHWRELAECGLAIVAVVVDCDNVLFTGAAGVMDAKG